eukprot:gene12366-16588_t
MCAFTPPGSPALCNDPGKLLGERIVMIDGRKMYQMCHKLTVANNVNYRYCGLCKCVKPPRAHHCSVSERCIFNMDHYCPWMNNCIGFNNYRYFMLFLVFMLVGSTYLIVVTYQFIVPFPIHHDGEASHLLLIDDVSATNSVFTLALSAWISVAALLSWHIYLCLTNQTSIEFYINLQASHEARLHGIAYRNPFDDGWRKNLRRILGDVPWYYNLWPNFRSPPDPKYPFDLRQYNNNADNIDYSHMNV